MIPGEINFTHQDCEQQKGHVYKWLYFIDQIFQNF